MNILLSLNKKFFLIFSLIVFFLIIFLLSIVYFKSNHTNSVVLIKNNQLADITKPKFSINSKKQKILITANEGNFLTTDKILLEENVIFKSNKFKLYGNNVIFNKKELVASSLDKSKFVSKNASIESIGFDIIENGSIINFKGKTKLILK